MLMPLAMPVMLRTIDIKISILKSDALVRPAFPASQCHVSGGCYEPLRRFRSTRRSAARPFQRRRRRDPAPPSQRREAALAGEPPPIAAFEALARYASKGRTAAVAAGRSSPAVGPRAKAAQWSSGAERAVVIPNIRLH